MRPSGVRQPTLTYFTHDAETEKDGPLQLFQP